MKKILKSALIVLFVVILGGCSKVVSDNKMDYEAYYKIHMESLYEVNKYLPSVDEVLNNDNFQFKHYKNQQFIFVGYGTVVSHKLTEEDFKAKKEELSKTYTFLDEPVHSMLTEDMIVIPEVSFEIDGYSFSVISDGDYPNDFGMIAFSEEQNRILYFAYYDTDLDYIEDMEDFVEETYPGWNKW